MVRLKVLTFILGLSIGLGSFGQLYVKGTPLEVPVLKSQNLTNKVVYMPKFDLSAIEKNKSDINEKSIKFAHSFEVCLSPENSGEWFTIDGYRVWQLQIESNEAKSLHLIFTKYFLPQGARLYLFDPQKENVLGAFTSRNNKPYKKLAIYPLPGDVVIIQYEEPIDAEFQAELEIGKVNHDYLGIVPLKNRWDRRPSGDCNVDVNCETSSGLNDQKRAVVRILSDDELGTATLLNNTSGNGIPYAISAFHIYDNTENAEITLYDFNYESPFCTKIEGYDNQSISGSTAIASFDSLDFMFVQLSETPPASFRPYYAGWDARSQIPFNSSTIHHPNGDVKKITHDDGKCDSISYSNEFLKNAHWKVFNWESGTTESGSSGAGLFNNSKRLVGTLSGGYASCTNFSYDAFSRFDKMWNTKSADNQQIKRWLDPENTGVRIIDGMDPYASDNSNCTVICNFLINDEAYMVNDLLDLSDVTEIAERFDQTETVQLSGISVGIKDYSPTLEYENLTIIVYSGEEEPQIAEKIVKFPVNKLTKNAMNYFSFTEPIILSGKYFISVKLPSKKGSLVLFQSNFRPFKNSKSMLKKENDVWQMVVDNSKDSLGASLLIQANICGATFKSDSLQPEVYSLMEMYPNPVSSFLIVEFNKLSENCEINIFDLAGKVVIEECFENRKYAEIDTNSLSPGIYLLRIKIGNKFETKRFIKK